MRGKCLWLAVHVRGNLKITLVNDVPHSLVAINLNIVANPTQHVPSFRFSHDCPRAERILLMREIFDGLNRSASIADVAADTAAEGIARDTLCVHCHLPAAGTREVSALLLGKFGNENPRQRFLVWFDTFDFPCLAAVGFGFFSCLLLIHCEHGGGDPLAVVTIAISDCPRFVLHDGSFHSIAASMLLMTSSRLSTALERLSQASSAFS